VGVLLRNPSGSRAQELTAAPRQRAEQVAVLYDPMSGFQVDESGRAS
jgi:hypothetical protein